MKMKIHNLSLHFPRQDGQGGKNGKENHATKVTKIQKTKKTKVCDERNINLQIPIERVNKFPKLETL